MTIKRNICLTINSLVSGGAEKQCLVLAKALQPYHNVFVVILNSSPIYPPRLAFIEEEKIDHIFLSKNPVKKTAEFTGFLKKQKIEILFSFLPADTVLASICGRLANVPFVFGGIRNSRIAKMKYAILKIIHNSLCNYSISNSYSAYRTAIENGFQDKLLVIPNGIEIRPLEEIHISNHKMITIISMGRLVKQKDYETAIKSIARLKATLKNKFGIRYLIVGSGPDESIIRDLIKTHDLEDEIQVITNATDVYKLLESADIYLCSSIFEGISNSIMEAMNCCLPIVATDAGDNSRLVIDGKNGFITDLYDYQKIADQLSYLINSPEARHRMGLESYRYLKSYYGFEEFQKKYLNVIRNVESLEVRDGEPHFNGVLSSK